MIRSLRSPAILLTLLLSLMIVSGTVFALSNIFTYQGSLEDGGNPADGSYDLQFTLLGAMDSPVGAPVLRDNVVVAGGVFTVELDFGTNINSGDFRLQIGVRPGDSDGSYTLLSPTTRIAPTPQAQVAGTAAVANTVSPNSINSASIADGTIASADIGDGNVTSADITDGTIASADIGDGNVTSADITDGTVTSTDIANSTIVSADITDGTIASADIATGAVTSADIADETIVSADIDDGTIAAVDVNSNQIQRRVATGCASDEAIRSINADGTVVCVEGPLGPPGGTEVAFGTLYLFDDDFGDTRNFAVADGRLALLNASFVDTSSDVNFLNGSDTIIAFLEAGYYEASYHITFRATDATPDIDMTVFFSLSTNCVVGELLDAPTGIALMEVSLETSGYFYPISGSEVFLTNDNSCMALKAYEFGAEADNEAEMVRIHVTIRRVR